MQELLLEGIGLGLPTPVQLDSHLDATEDHLLSSSKVDSQLYDVSIVDRERLGFRAWWAEPDVIKKCARRAFDIPDVPFAVFEPKLAVPSADDFTLEAYGSGRGSV